MCQYDANLFLQRTYYYLRCCELKIIDRYSEELLITSFLQAKIAIAREPRRELNEKVLVPDINMTRPSCARIFFFMLHGDRASSFRILIITLAYTSPKHGTCPYQRQRCSTGKLHIYRRLNTRTKSSYLTSIILSNEHHQVLSWVFIRRILERFI